MRKIIRKENWKKIVKHIIPEEILNNPIDEEEAELFQKLQNQEFVEEYNSWKLKSKTITIRMPVFLIETIKQKAAKEWLPYQTYIKHILHKAVMED